MSNEKASQSHKRLSDCYRLQTKFVDAINEFQKALEIHQKHFPDKKEEYAQLQEEFQGLQEQAIQPKSTLIDLHK